MKEPIKAELLGIEALEAIMGYESRATIVNNKKHRKTLPMKAQRSKDNQGSAGALGRVYR